MRQLESAKYPKTWELTREKKEDSSELPGYGTVFWLPTALETSIAKRGLRVGCWKCEPCLFSDTSHSVWWQQNGSMLLVLEGWGGSLKLSRNKFCTRALPCQLLVREWKKGSFLVLPPQGPGWGWQLPLSCPRQELFLPHTALHSWLAKCRNLQHETRQLLEGLGQERYAPLCLVLILPIIQNSSKSCVEGSVVRSYDVRKMVFISVICLVLKNVFSAFVLPIKSTFISQDSRP